MTSSPGDGGAGTGPGGDSGTGPKATVLRRITTCITAWARVAYAIGELTTSIAKGDRP